MSCPPDPSPEATGLAALALAASPDGVLAFDRECRYTLWNAAMERLSGVPAAEAIGRVAFELFPFLVQTGEDRCFREALAGRTASSADRPFTVPETGHAGFYEARYGPLREAAGAVVGGVGVIRDVTTRVRAALDTAAARERAEQALRLHTLVLERMSEGVSVTDEHGVIVYTNPAEDRMFGYAPGELIGRHVTVQNTYAPEENARIVGEVIAQLRSRGYWEGEWDNVRKDGTPFVTHARITALELDGAPYWVCVQEDVTERRNAARRQAFLDEASRLLAGPVAEERTLAQLVRHCVPALADYASIDVLTADGEIRRVETAHVDPGQERLVRELWDRYPYRAADRVGVPALLRTGEPQFLPEMDDELVVAFARDAEHLGLLRAVGARSYVAVPLVARGRTYGALSLVRTAREAGGSGRRFARADLDLALELARRAASVVDNARAYEAERAAREQAERAERRVAFLARASAALAASLDVEGTLATVARLAVPDLADWCFVELLDEAGIPRPSVVHHRDPERVMIGWEVMTRWPIRPENRFGSMEVARTGVPALVPEIPDGAFAQVAHDEEHLRVLRETGFRSTVQVPLRARVGAGEGESVERVVGVLTFAATDESGRRYGPTDLALAEEVAARAGVALENARLFAAERAARAEAEEARARAEEANRGKSQFLATMSHELRTPLNAIAGHVQLLELGIHGPLTDAQRDALARVDRAQRHLLGLINDVLNYARIESGRVEYDLRPVPLAEVVQDVRPMVDPQLHAKGLAFEVRFADGADGADGAEGGALLVWADREKLTQILLNLLSNAAKFTPSGGRVTVELSGRDEGEAPAELAALRVTDTGVGIPRDKLEAVFEPFVQVRSDFTRDAGGTGLGLAISRDLARGMGGELRARSTEGVGSTFTVTLRRVVTAAGEPVDRRTGEERRTEEERRSGADRRHEGGGAAPAPRQAPGDGAAWPDV